MTKITLLWVISVLWAFAPISRCGNVNAVPTVSFQLVGAQRHCPRDAGKKEFLLGWGDRTCAQLAAVGPQLLTNTSSTTDFRSWDVEFVTQRTMLPIVRLATHPPANGNMPCSGSLAVANPQSCSDARVTIATSPVQDVSDQFVMVPVPKNVRVAAGEVYLVAKSRQRGCARFLSAVPGCRHAFLKLATKDDGSGLQRWVRSRLVLPPPPSPVINSPPVMKSPAMYPPVMPPPTMLPPVMPPPVMPPPMHVVPMPVPSPMSKATCAGDGDLCGPGSALSCCDGLLCNLKSGFGYMCTTVVYPPPSPPPPSPPPPSPPPPSPAWVKQTSSSFQYWASVASSSDGSKLAAAVFGSYIYTSIDSGVTWTKQTNTGPQTWASVASSSDGSKLAAAVSGGDIFTSNDSGVTWTKQTNSSSQYWASVASSSDGSKLAAAVNGGYIFTSNDSGVTWTNQTNSGSQTWASVASSSDGSKLAAAVSGGDIFTSNNSGVTWTNQTNSGSQYWASVASSSDGSKLAAAVNGGYIFTSNDSGVTWTNQTNSGSQKWNAVASSSNGSKLAAAVYGGYIYTYSK